VEQKPLPHLLIQEELWLVVMSLAMVMPTPFFPSPILSASRTAIISNSWVGAKIAPSVFPQNSVFSERGKRGLKRIQISPSSMPARKKFLISASKERRIRICPHCVWGPGTRVFLADMEGGSVVGVWSGGHVGKNPQSQASHSHHEGESPPPPSIPPPFPNPNVTEIYSLRRQQASLARK